MVASAASYTLWLVVKGLMERGELAACEYPRASGGGPLAVKPPRRLIRNAALCTKCNTILESKHTHDYQGCACGNAVDGGLEYIRRVGRPEELEELSEWGN